MSGAHGTWAQAAGDEHARLFDGTPTGIAEAMAYASSKGASGYVCCFPSASTISPPSSIPVGVLVDIITGGRRTSYAAGGIVTAASRRRNLRAFGAVGDGSHDDTSAIMAAWADLPAFGGILEGEDGSFKHTSQLVFDTKRTVITGYGSGVVWNAPSACTFINASTATFGMIFMQDRSGMDGVSYIGTTDGGGTPIGTVNGVQFLNNSCFLRNTMIAKMVQDGCWFGDNPSGAGSTNLNFWYMEHAHFAANGRDGVFLSARDSGSGANANAGVANRVSSVLNGRNGVRIRDSGKNLWNGLCTEANVKEGIYILGMGHQNIFVGGDQEANFQVPPLPTTVPPAAYTVQIKISNEEGSGHVPISCAFYDVGINAGTSIVDQGLHTRFHQTDYPFPLPQVLGAISQNANGPNQAASIPSTPAGSGIYHSLYDQGGERVRFGIISDVAGLAQSILAAQFMAGTNSVTHVASRSGNADGTPTDGGAVWLEAGSTQQFWAKLSNALGFESNRNININTTAPPGYAAATGYFVGGTKVVGARGAAVTAPTDLATCITAINAIISRLQAHGLIS